MTNSLGTIIATEDSPSTTNFAFVIDKNADVKKGQYIEVNGFPGKILGHVSEITRANRYFERAESVAEYEKHTNMETQFPADSWEYVVAEVRILGNYEEGKFLRTFSPPKPGTIVKNVDNNTLKKFLGFQDNGLFLGEIQHHDVEARPQLTKLLQKHLAILAMSGAGKSHLSSVLLEELLERKKEDGRVAVVIIDIHGEYIGFAHDEKYGARTTVIEGKDIKVPLRKVSPEMMQEWLPNLSPAQKEVLRNAMIGVKKENKDTEGWSLKQLLEAVEASGETKSETSKLALKRTLGGLRSLRLLSKKDESPHLLSQVKPGKLLIMDLSDIDSLQKKQIIVSMIARRLFRLRKNNKIPPYLMLIEEAHNFADQSATTQAISRSVIETIAREGRKFGASLCLVSQRPVNLSTTALSQCNTHVILRVTNPNDLDHIQMSSEGIDSRIARSITSLKVGEAIIVGEAVNYPVFVSVRNRKSEKREKGAPLDQQARDFEESEKKKQDQVEAFL